jgi:predicted fused transcriptional regulator/phosphomethylpyrimidine kinase
MSSTGETVNTVVGETKRDPKFRRNVRFESDVNSELMSRLNRIKEFDRAMEFQRVQQSKIPWEAKNYGKSMENIKHV